MKKNGLTAFCICGALLFTGCFESAIECDDADAQRLVVEIFTESSKDIFLGARGRYVSFQKSQDTEMLAAAAKADSIISNLNPQLANIRVENVNDKLMKSECSGEIVYANGDKMDINYNLSKTTDGNLYAEILGLWE